MPSPSESVPFRSTTLIERKPEAPSLLAEITTVPVAFAVTSPSVATVAIAGVVVLYVVPEKPLVTLALGRPGYDAMTVSCRVALIAARLVVGAVTAREAGIAVVLPS